MMTTVCLVGALAAVGAAAPAAQEDNKVVRHSRSSFTLRRSATGFPTRSSLALGAKAELVRSVVKGARGARAATERQAATVLTDAPALAVLVEWEVKEEEGVVAPAAMAARRSA